MCSRMQNRTDVTFSPYCAYKHLHYTNQRIIRSNRRPRSLVVGDELNLKDSYGDSETSDHTDIHVVAMVLKATARMSVRNAYSFRFSDLQIVTDIN